MFLVATLLPVLYISLFAINNTSLSRQPFMPRKFCNQRPFLVNCIVTHLKRRQQQYRISTPVWLHASSTSASCTNKMNNNSSSSSSSDSSSSSSNSSVTKDIWIIRHGQAVHNVRAEYARNVLRCNHDEFLSIMEQDDCFDAPLTTIGIQEAQQIYTRYGSSQWATTTTSTTRPGTENTNSLERDDSRSEKPNVELVVSSPLSRALLTADLAMGGDDGQSATTSCSTTGRTVVDVPNRVCYEGFREINGWLLNGKRHTRNELKQQFPKWDFSLLASNDDIQWTTQLETTTSCMERGYHGLLWMMKERSERSIVLVSHGALLKYTLTEHPNVILRDGRKQSSLQQQQQQPHNLLGDDEKLTDSDQQQNRCIRERYHNCEIRRYHMELGDVPGQDIQQFDDIKDVQQEQYHRDMIILTEVDL